MAGSVSSQVPESHLWKDALDLEATTFSLVNPTLVTNRHLISYLDRFLCSETFLKSLGKVRDALHPSHGVLLQRQVQNLSSFGEGRVLCPSLHPLLGRFNLRGG